jgi:hypothetical protein
LTINLNMDAPQALFELSEFMQSHVDARYKTDGRWDAEKIRSTLGLTPEEWVQIHKMQCLSCHDVLQGDETVLKNLVRVCQLTLMIQEDALPKWLHTPNPGFDNLEPVTLMLTTPQGLVRIGDIVEDLLTGQPD